MRYGFVLPRGDARHAADLAAAAERAGWDGFFVWEPVWGVDAWVSLAAAAMTTERIRLGTMITPVSRRKPWELASQTATLDRLSKGRLILSVGLGAPDTGFGAFGEATERRARAMLLDEGLDVLVALWKGKPIAYEGRHYRITETTFPPCPPPVQKPRPPIWVVGALGHERSMTRALRYDGVLPATVTPDGTRQATPAEIAAASLPRALDVVVEGTTPGDDPAAARATTQPWEEAGATWWIEARWNARSLADVRRRIEQGPPRPTASARRGAARGGGARRGSAR